VTGVVSFAEDYDFARGREIVLQSIALVALKDLTLGRDFSYRQELLTAKEPVMVV
jgi:hypothetical protein